MKGVKKRLTTVLVGQVMPIIAVPLLAKYDIPADAIVQIVVTMEAILGVYIGGQSWTDTKLIEKGKKDA